MAAQPVDTVPEPNISAINQREARRWLRNLDNIEGVDLPTVGGKAFRLAQLKQHGLAVPPGLVLTTHFFETQLQHNKFAPLWAGSPDVDVTAEALSWLANVLKTRPLARSLANALNRGLTEQFGPSATSFAVRSSAIDEDQRDHTFAGIHLTELGVPRSAIPIAVSRCWASALSGTAIQYRQHHGMSIQSIKIAVLIQPMLSPTCSGVGFTLNPLTGERSEMIIEAAPGLGNAVVSGSLRPWFFRLAHQHPKFPLIEQRAGEDSAGSAPPLAPDDLASLARILHQIAALLGEPQDVEWARQNDTFFILQTRPVSTQPPRPEQPDQFWTRGQYVDYLPDVPSPFWGSLLERAQTQTAAVFADLGLHAADSGPYERLIFGRPYLNLSLLKQLAATVGLNLDGILQSSGYARMATTTSLFSIDWRSAWAARQFYFKLVTRLRAAPQAVAQSQEQVEQIVTALQTAPPATAAESQVPLLDRLYLTLFSINLRLEIGIALVTAVATRLVKPKAGTSAAAVVSSLAASQLQPARSQLYHMLAQLGEMANHNKSLAEYLPDAAPDFVDFETTPAVSSHFRQAFAAVLAKFGHRATFDADPGWPRYSEHPAELLQIVAQFAQHSTSAAAGLTPTDTGRLGHAALNQLPRFSWRRVALAQTVSALRQLLALRNQLDQIRAEGMFVARQWALALGQAWVKIGWLSQATDIFWLSVDDIERTLVAGDSVGLTLTANVRVQKETHQRYQQLKAPYNVQQSQLSAIELGLDAVNHSLSDALVGLPVSPGQARGRVVVVQHPAEFTAATDTILVLPSTGPDWLPLLHLASGLIVETGGLLSHGSVIAREYGIPAVANIPQASRRFRTGDRVLVDGSTGVVQLL